MPKNILELVNKKGASLKQADKTSTVFIDRLATPFESTNEFDDPPNIDTQSGEVLQPLWTDKKLSALTGFAVSTFRGQRHLRRHNKPHWFDVDPIPGLPAPRYRHVDIAAWFHRFMNEA